MSILLNLYVYLYKRNYLHHITACNYVGKQNLGNSQGLERLDKIGRDYQNSYSKTRYLEIRRSKHAKRQYAGYRGAYYAQTKGCTRPTTDPCTPVLSHYKRTGILLFSVRRLQITTKEA